MIGSDPDAGGKTDAAPRRGMATRSQPLKSLFSTVA
jgi:hypothetical protein